MKENDPRPKRLLLYLIVGIVIFLLFLEVKTPLSRSGHIVVEGSLVIGLYGFVMLWLKSNDHALYLEDLRKNKPASRTYSEFRPFMEDGMDERDDFAKETRE